MRLDVPGFTEVLMGRGLPTPLLPERERGLVVIVTQPRVQPVAHAVRDALGGAAPIVELPDGEAAKTLASIEQLLAALDDHGVRRDGALVAVGGGSITDVTGFAAAIWLRGIEAVHVPTTLLAAVDAAIGGKTGINFRGKNLVGAFWEPSRVIIDLAVLEALAPITARQGWAEILKAGLIADASLVADIEEHGTDLDLETAVARSVAVKATVVADDLRESGRRAILNFGHTIGHAVEMVSGISHGEAVALGLVAEAAASEVDRGFRAASRVSDVVTQLGFATQAPAMDRDRAMHLAGKDKKGDQHGIRMVMLDRIGEPVLVRPSAEALDAAWSAIGL